jgi:hypothetical protein
MNSARLLPRREGVRRAAESHREYDTRKLSGVHAG